MERILAQCGDLKLIYCDVDPRRHDDLVIKFGDQIKRTFNSLSCSYAFSDAYYVYGIYEKAVTYDGKS